MNGCFGNTTRCSGREMRACKLMLRRDPRTICADCREVMAGMGVSFTVIEEARPAWLSRLTAVDRTGAVLR